MKTLNTILALVILLVVSACDCKKSCEQPKDCKAGCKPVCK